MRAPLVAGGLALALLVGTATMALAGGDDPKNGRYAGGAKKVAVWFDVSSGAVQSGRVRGIFPGCDESMPVIDSDEPDGQGRFEISASGGGDTVTIEGRFRTPTKVSGKVIWAQTNSICPADTYGFEYAAKRRGGL